MGYTCPSWENGCDNPKLRCSFRDTHSHGTPLVLYQLISLAGAFLILLAYLGNTRNWFGPKDRAYNTMNLLGGLLLFWIALVDRRAGFMVLELTWALLAVPPLLRAEGAARQGSP